MTPPCQETSLKQKIRILQNKGVPAPVFYTGSSAFHFQGSRLWITGTQQLVDCTAGHGKDRTKLLKIYLSNFGFLPGRAPKESPTDSPDDPETADAAPPLVEVLDGERESLPE